MSCLRIWNLWALSKKKKKVNLTKEDKGETVAASYPKSNVWAENILLFTTYGQNGNQCSKSSRRAPKDFWHLVRKDLFSSLKLQECNIWRTQHLLIYILLLACRRWTMMSSAPHAHRGQLPDHWNDCSVLGMPVPETCWLGSSTRCLFGTSHCFFAGATVISN